MADCGAFRLTQYQWLLSAVLTSLSTRNLSSSQTSLPRVSPCHFGPSWSSWLSLSFPGSLCPFSPSLGSLSFMFSQVPPLSYSLTPRPVCSILLLLCSECTAFSPCSRLFQMPVAVVSVTLTVKTFLLLYHTLEWLCPHCIPGQVLYFIYLVLKTRRGIDELSSKGLGLSEPSCWSD